MPEFLIRYMLVFSGLLLTVTHIALGEDVIVLQDTPDQLILPGPNPFEFVLATEHSAVVADVTIAFTLDHPNPREVSVSVEPPMGGLIPLAFPGELRQRNLFTYVFTSTTHTPMRRINGIDGNGIDDQGVWKLVIQDPGRSGIGRLISWRLEIVPAVVHEISWMDEETGNSLRLAVDGYGSFGNQGHYTEFPTGAPFSVQDFAVNTVYHSALFLHSEKQFLSSYAMYPGSRLPVLSFEAGGALKSHFQVGQLDIELTQWGEVRENEFFLYQKYEFFSRRTVRYPFVLTRYIKPQLADSENYAVVQETADEIQGLAVFDEIRSATTDVSLYVGIAAETPSGAYWGHAYSHWLYGSTTLKVADLLYQHDLRYFDEDFSKAGIQDANQDYVTDPGKGFDIAFALATVLSFDQNNRASYTAVTRWGISSPAEFLSTKDDVEPTPTPLPSATPVPAAPVAIFALPDIRLLKGVEANEILDLDDYVHDADTPREQLQWSITNSQGLPLRIDDDNQLSCGAVNKTGNYEAVTLQVSDGTHTLEFNLRIKVSSVLLKEFYSIPPIVFATNEEIYTSPYSLNDLVEAVSPAEGAMVGVAWSVPTPYPAGIRKVEILEDHSFQVYADQDLSPEPVYLPLRAERVVQTYTPTITPTEEAQTPTAVPTPTVTRVPPTPVFTPTPTPGATECLPVDQIIAGEALEFQGPGMMDWLVLEESTLGSNLLALANYDGLLSVYQFQDGTYKQHSEIGFGVLDIEAGDVTRGGEIDVVSFAFTGVSQEIHLIAGEDGFASIYPFVLPESYWFDPGLFYQWSQYPFLAIGAIDADGKDEIALRLKDGVLLLTWKEGILQVMDEIPVSGTTRMLHGEDFDRDGDMDLLVGVSNQLQESLLILKNENGRYVESQTLAVWDDFIGNYPKQVVPEPLNTDDYADLLVLDYGNTLSYFEGQGDAAFNLKHKLQPFPPGVVESIALGDVNHDGFSDVLAVHRGPEGIFLYVYCGEEMGVKDSFVRFHLRSNTIERYRYVPGVMDIDQDGDLDILLSIDLFNRMLIFDNLLRE